MISVPCSKPALLVVAIVVAYLVSTYWSWLKKQKSRRLPPSPRGLPILGHLLMLGKNPHHILHALAKKHGPIMYMRFGIVPNIIVSSPQAAKQFLKTNDLVFANRPSHEGSKYISWNQKNIIFGKYGPYWRDMRKLCTLELLSNHKINSFQAMRRDELCLLIESTNHAAEERVCVDLSVKVSSMIADMSCIMIFGKKNSDRDFDKRGFTAVIQEGMQIAAAPNLGDYFPYLGVLDLQGLTRRFKGIKEVWDQFFDKIIDEHVHSRGKVQTNKDFVDTLMDIMESGQAGVDFGRENVKAILLDMVVGSMDTSSTSIEWVLSELLKHPRVMNKVQKELENIVGMERMVEESDLERLEYLDMVIKESYRLHPIVPLLLPHEAMEDCIIDGYDIPKKSTVLINVWSIGRDPDAWTEPEKFFPERFEGSSIDLRGRDFQLIPFGSGRRGCPGIQLGLKVVKLVVAQLAHVFNLELPNNMKPSDLDMIEEFGLVVSRANHLMAIPTYRLDTKGRS